VHTPIHIYEVSVAQETDVAQWLEQRHI
jgi:hypothetical protein